MTDVARVVVEAEYAGMRLDAYMAASGLYPTRSAAAKCVADGFAALNGKPGAQKRLRASGRCAGMRNL